MRMQERRNSIPTWLRGIALSMVAISVLVGAGVVLTSGSQSLSQIVSIAGAIVLGVVALMIHLFKGTEQNR
jgi:hypothetical protein